MQVDSAGFGQFLNQNVFRNWRPLSEIFQKLAEWSTASPLVREVRVRFPSRARFAISTAFRAFARQNQRVVGGSGGFYFEDTSVGFRWATVITDTETTPKCKRVVRKNAEIVGSINSELH